MSDDGVRWCLLRGVDDLAVPVGDVDVLVHRDDLAAAAAGVLASGFRTLPVPGRGAHRVFHAFEPHEGAWLRVDAVTDLAFGPYGALPEAEADDILERAVIDGDLRYPDADDAFWLLLGHCLLEKPSPPGHHRAALVDLAGVAGNDGPVGAAVARLLGRPADSLRLLAREDRWDAFGGVGRQARMELVRRSPRVAARWAAHRAARGSTKLHIARRRRGITVAVTGADPRARASAEAAMVRRLPIATRRRTVGADPGPPSVAGLLALLRLGASARIDVVRGRVVVLDGVPSGDAPVPGSHPLGTAARWIADRALPRADLVVVLDASGDAGARPPGAFALDPSGSGDEMAPALAALVWEACTGRWGHRRGEKTPR